MESIEEVLNFIVNKNLEIILDNISTDFNIERDKLDKYIILDQSKILTDKSNNINTSTDTICQGKTKKGEICRNKAKPNTNFCGKHS
jgi:hypothetical protein